MINKIKVVGFDADDTLWINEPLFREVEHEFCQLFNEIISENEVIKILFKTEIDNLTKYGYGSRSFMLSMIETTLNILDEKISAFHIKKIMNFGNYLLTQPRELLDGVESTLQYLYNKYKLVLITKGDLLEQQQKLDKSGLAKYFHHIEIISEKNMNNYNVIFDNLNIKFSQFLMVGNSLKSDIEPILKLGCYGAYIPYHITWQHEQMDVNDVANEKFIQLNKISELKEVL